VHTPHRPLARSVGAFELSKWRPSQLGATPCVVAIQYVIPYAWRSRRVELPERGRLTEGGVPDETAAIYAGRVVSVNYHPGSLCCLLEHYRFRDEKGHLRPVKIRDCSWLDTATLTNIRVRLDG